MIATYSGIVQSRSGRGTTLGFPTVNIAISESVNFGIYAGYVQWNGQRYQAAIFSDTPHHIEAHILDFSGNIYNQPISIELHKKIRDAQTFATTAELIEAIRDDVVKTRQCLPE